MVPTRPERDLITHIPNSSKNLIASVRRRISTSLCLKQYASAQLPESVSENAEQSEYQMM